MTTCSKCGKVGPTERHHLYPQCHFGSGRRNARTVRVCHECHVRLELIITAVEHFVTDCPPGKRAMLDPSDYDRIHQFYFRNSRIIYFEAS